MLDRALVDAGIDREPAYVTNAVKHFTFTQREGKRRIHAKPDTADVAACRPWLAAELAVLDPEVVVCLGATAVQSLLGHSFRVTKSRGSLLPWPTDAEEDAGRKAAFILATIHPSAVLRAGAGRDAAYDELVADLRVVATVLAR